MADSSLLTPNQLRALARLKAIDALRPFYLAGGTAVAFHLGHRVSRDLDLFGSMRDVDLDSLQRVLTQHLPDLEVLAITDATLQVKLEGLPIDLVRYAYAPLEPTKAGPAGFSVAGKLDLAVMKLAAIAHRGLRRDFWDLHELITRGGVSLEPALDAYLKRFGKAEPDLYHVLRSLTFFDDAEQEALMPAGLTATHWEAIRQYFLAEAPKSLRVRTQARSTD